MNPLNLYPEISVCDNQEAVLAHYSKGRVVDLAGSWKQLYYVHAVYADKLVVRNGDAASFSYEVVDCQGNVCSSGRIDGNLLTQIDVPTAGMVTFVRQV